MIETVFKLDKFADERLKEIMTSSERLAGKEPADNDSLFWRRQAILHRIELLRNAIKIANLEVELAVKTLYPNILQLVEDYKKNLASANDPRPKIKVKVRKVTEEWTDDKGE